jgi:predicted ATPase
LSIAYITPLRAAAERYYRQQGLATNELDAKGENFALFLRSLNNRERESLRKWLGSALGVYVDLDESVGHVSLYLVDEKTKSRVNLADTGFGYSQLLPIAIQLWLTQTRKRLLYGVTRFNSSSSTLVVIEQPELHLHPRVQAKVADLLAHATSSKNDGFEARVIVETHSEALVNRLGKLVANGTLQPSDVNVVLFNKPNFSEPTVVTTTSFDSNGFLQDWPLGFFNSD